VRVRMLHDRTGGRYDGQSWPVPGRGADSEFDVPGEEAEHLIRVGAAEAVEPPVVKRGPGRPPKSAAAPAAAEDSG
jgi:hypothetical protein